MVIKKWRKELAALLQEKENASFDADAILCEVCGITKDRLLMGDFPVSEAQQEKSLALTKRRARGEPLQYLLKTWEFYGLSFAVGPGVLIPRQETETLVEQALTVIGSRQATVLDLCAGTGCVGIAIATHAPNVSVTVIENAPSAISFLRRNVAKNAPSVRVLTGDIFSFDTVRKAGNADVIVCNPPYLSREDMHSLQPEVAFEPKEALFGGEDGLDYYRRLPSFWLPVLRTGGSLLVEIGAGQSEAVRELLERAGLREIVAHKDASGHSRVLCAVKRAD